MLRFCAFETLVCCKLPFCSILVLHSIAYSVCILKLWWEILRYCIHCGNVWSNLATVS